MQQSTEASDEKNPLLRLYDEVINQGRLDILDELYVDGYVNDVAPFGLSKGVDGLRRLFEEFMIGIPDQHIEYEVLLSTPGQMITKWKLTGTHTGTFFGIPATGRKISMEGVDIENFKDGRISRHWGVEDQLTLLGQIDAIHYDPRFVRR